MVDRRAGGLRRVRAVAEGQFPGTLGRRRDHRLFLSQRVGALSLPGRFKRALKRKRARPKCGRNKLEVGWDFEDHASLGADGGVCPRIEKPGPDVLMICGDSRVAGVRTATYQGELTYD